MKKIKLFLILILLTIFLPSCTNKNSTYKKENNNFKQLNALVIAHYNDFTYLLDSNNIIYKFNSISPNLGDYIKITYEGTLDSQKDLQNIDIKTITINEDSFYLNTLFNNNFSNAQQIVAKMTLEEKIGQIFMVHHSATSISDVKNLYLGGFVFFGADFKDKTKEEVIEMFNNLNQESKIPLYIAVDEEGGNVVRISSNKNLVQERFKSPQELYQIGGFEKIKEDNIYKNNILESLGININLAPVVDMCNDKDSYIYNRTIALDKDKTGEFAKVIIESSKESSISNTLKHYPGYSNNLDTHKSDSSDFRTIDDLLNNDLVPFKIGIDAGAESIMVSHNILSNIDSMPSTLSSILHNILRDNLNFKGMIITDALNMGALDNIEDIPIKALLAGNDILITKNYKDDIERIKQAIENNELSVKLIDILALKNIMWKLNKDMF